GLGATAVGLGEDDAHVLTRGADGDPTEAVGGHVVADLEPEGVAVEAEGLVGGVDQDEGGGEGDCHADDGTGATPAHASPILLAWRAARLRPGPACAAAARPPSSRRGARARGGCGRGPGTATASRRRSR